MSETLVTVKDLVKVYEPSPLWMKFLLRSAIKEPVTAVDHLSFEVKAGEICAIVGPNGAGKSTLFRVLTGLTTPTEGTATVLDLDVSTQSHAVRRVVGFVPADDRSLYLRHTAAENLKFHANLQGLPRRQIDRRVKASLELVGLGSVRNRVGFALSAGMRSRLQLARALLHDPRVLILDEPTGAIDPVASYHLLEKLEEVTAERNLAVLVSSHRLEEIEALHDSVLLLDRGKLVFRGRLGELRRSWETPRLQIRFTTEDAASEAVKRLQGQSGVEVLAAEPPTVLVATTLNAGRVLGFLNGQLSAIESVAEASASLREVLAGIASRSVAADAGGTEQEN